MTKPMNKQSARRRVVASKRLEPTPAPARPGEPDWREWNFAKVTESELAACCLWEYARESNTIRADCRRWTENPDPIIFGEAVIERMERLGAMLFHGYFGSEPVTYFPDPWQQLPSEIKQQCVKVFGHHAGASGDFEVSDIHPEPISFPISQETANVLYVQAKKLCRERKESFQKNLPFSSRRVSQLDDAGKEVMILRIDWAEFRTTEIAKFFEKWIKDKRPPTIPEPCGRGHDPTEECRASLERLALLRLRSHYTLDETLAILAKLPKEQRKKSKFLEPSECNREAEKAVVDFHKLLHFLDPTEMPRSWPLK